MRPVSALDSGHWLRLCRGFALVLRDNALCADLVAVVRLL